MTKYINVINGSYPLLITVPHGGTISSTTIPDRICDSTSRDVNTTEFAETLCNKLALQGKNPYSVVLTLSRKKVDVNRQINVGCENTAAESVWSDYHKSVQRIINECINKYNRCFIIDLHGQNHPGKRIELGYCINKEQLIALASGKKSASPSITKSRDLDKQKEIIFGDKSLGSILESTGLKATPSNINCLSLDEAYFSGGYTTEKYCSLHNVIGLQVELNFKGMRDSEKNVQKSARLLAKALSEYLTTNNF